MKKLVVDFIEKEVVDRKIKDGEISSVFIKIVSNFEDKTCYGEAKYTVPKKYRSLVSTQFVEDVAYLKAVVDLIDNYMKESGDKNEELVEGRKEVNQEVAELIRGKIEFCKRILKHRSEPEDYRKSKTYLVNEDATKALEIK